MTGSETVRVGPIVRHIVAVVVLTLVLGGLGANPVSANQRGNAVNEANSVITACFKSDGEILHTHSGDRSISVSCAYNDGILSCTWWADVAWYPDCYWIPNPITGSPDGGAAVAGGSSNLPGRVTSVAPGPVTVVTASTQATGGDQDTGEPQQKASSKAKSKKGKSHGKGHYKGGKRR